MYRRKTIAASCLSVFVLISFAIGRWQISTTERQTTAMRVLVARKNIFAGLAVNATQSFAVNESAMTQSQRYKWRLTRLKEMCDRFKGSSTSHRDVAQDPTEYLVVDEKHKLVYCNVPKISCSSWKRVFLTIAGVDLARNASIHQRGVNWSGRKFLNYVHKYENITKRREILNTYKKFMFVRDPFTRLLSAYQNKLSPKSRKNTTRKSDYYTKVALNIIEQLYGVSMKRRVASNMGLYNLKFADFIHYLVDERTTTYDIHWESVIELCRPCDIDYDFIGKYETLEEDADFILGTAGIDVPFPKSLGMRTNSSVSSTVSEFYASASERDLKQLFYERFYLDFKLFDYSPTTFTKNVFPAEE